MKEDDLFQARQVTSSSRWQPLILYFHGCQKGVSHHLGDLLSTRHPLLPNRDSWLKHPLLGTWVGRVGYDAGGQTFICITDLFHATFEQNQTHGQSRFQRSKRQGVHSFSNVWKGRGFDFVHTLCVRQYLDVWKSWEKCETAKQWNLVFNCVHPEKSYTCIVFYTYIYIKCNLEMFVSIMDKYIYIHDYIYNYIYARIYQCLWHFSFWSAKDPDLFGSKNPSSNKSLWHHKCQSAYQSSLGHRKKNSWQTFWTSLVPKVGDVELGNLEMELWNDERIGSIPAILKAYRLDPRFREDCKKKTPHHRIVFCKVLGPYETWAITVYQIHVCQYTISWLIHIHCSIWIHDELKTRAFTI